MTRAHSLGPIWKRLWPNPETGEVLSVETRPYIKGERVTVEMVTTPDELDQMHVHLPSHENS